MTKTLNIKMIKWPSTSLHLKPNYNSALCLLPNPIQEFHWNLKELSFQFQIVHDPICNPSVYFIEFTQLQIDTVSFGYSLLCVCKHGCTNT